MVKNYVDKSVLNYSKINRKFYNTPIVLTDNPIFHGSLFDVLREPDRKYIEKGKYVKEFKLQKLNKVTNPQSSLCYTYRKFINKENKCDYELPLGNVEVNSNMF